MKLKSPFDFKATYIIGALLLAAVLGFGCHPVAAKGNMLILSLNRGCGEDVACWKTEADKQWKAENGDAQPNLTTEQEKEVRLIAVKMQAETRQ